jgi:hypothetical protein
MDMQSLVQFIGAMSASSFILIMVGDFFTACGDVIVRDYLSKQDSSFAKKLVFLWFMSKDLYEEFRKFLDRLSAYSRPRQPPPE